MGIETKQTYIFFDPESDGWFVTTDKQEAEKYEHYLATIEEVKIHSGTYGECFGGIVQTADGYLQYREYFDEDGNIEYGEYVNVTDHFTNKNRLATEANH